MLLRVGWGVILLALYLAGAAATLDSSAVWWGVAGLAVAAMVVSSLLPEPVPRDHITGRRNRVDAHRPLQ